LKLTPIGLGEAFEQLLRRRVVMEVVAAHAAPDHGSAVGSDLEVERGFELVLDPHPPVIRRSPGAGPDLLEGSLEPGVAVLPRLNAAGELRRGLIPCELIDTHDSNSFRTLGGLRLR